MSFTPQYHEFFITKKDENGIRYIFKSPHIEVIERNHFKDHSGFAIRIEFRNASGNVLQEEISFRQLSHNNLMHALAEAVNKRLLLPSTKEGRQELKRYLLEYAPSATVKKVEKIGYHLLDKKWIYALPATVIGSSDEKKVRLALTTDSLLTKRLSKKGKLKVWENEVAKPYADRPQIVYASCFALSGFILRFSGVENYAAHFYGSTSTGKSTTQVVASSVIGRVTGNNSNQRYMARWYTTENGAADIFREHNDLAAILDEIALLGGEKAKVRQIATNGVHVLESGASKKKAVGSNSANASGGFWNCIVLSSGNFSLGESAQENQNKRTSAAEVRFLDIPIPFNDQTVLGKLKLPSLSEIDADTCGMIHGACMKNYGVAGRAFVRGVVKLLNSKGADHLRDLIKGYIHEFQEFVNIDHGNNVQKRISMKFGLVYAAGMLAHKFGFLKVWSKSCIQKSIATCYMANTYTHGEFDPERALKQIHEFLKNNSKKFVKITSKNKWKTERQYKKFEDKYGFIYKLEDATFYLLKKEEFRRQACKGLFLSKVIETLTEKHLLKRGNQNKPAKKASWRTDKPYTFYWLNQEILETL